MITSEAVHLLSIFIISQQQRYRRCMFTLFFLTFISFIAPYSNTIAASNVGVIDLSQLEAIPISPRLVGTMDRQYINESSGLATSAIHDGILWTLNDSGNSAKIFPVFLNGTLLKSGLSVGFSIEGAENFDWEAMASDRKGTLYIADSGHNLNFARTPIIYQVAEPSSFDGTNSLPLLREIHYNYEDQSGFFMSRNEFDVEAVFYSDRTLNLITKGWGSSISKWYRLQESDEFGHAARLVTRVNFGKALITGAEVDQSGLRLAILAKRSIWLFTRKALGQNWFTGNIKYLRTRDIGVTEAITFYGNRLYISNETGELYTVSLDSSEQQ